MQHYTAHVTAFIQQSIVFKNADRLIVDTGKPFANMMHDTSRPFAVCKKIDNELVVCIGRYDAFGRAKAALKYLK